ncbi:hypothetical protein [Sphingomonas tagetis]|nr:hypothetical protein [Sphingomonas tagetis]
MEAWPVNGSYSFIENNLNDSSSTPSIDTWNAESSPGWEPIGFETMMDGSVIRFYKMIGGIDPAFAAVADYPDGNNSAFAIETA